MFGILRPLSGWILGSMVLMLVVIKFVVLAYLTYEKLGDGPIIQPTSLADVKAQHYADLVLKLQNASSHCSVTTSNKLLTVLSSDLNADLSSIVLCLETAPLLIERLSLNTDSKMVEVQLK